MKNSFGTNLKKGDTVKVSHPRGGFIISKIKSFETKGAFVRAYGKRVILENGMSVGLNDCSLTNEKDEKRWRENQLNALKPENIKAALEAQKLSTAAENNNVGWETKL